MIEENEIILFLLGLAVLIFILRNYNKIKELPHNTIFLMGFYLFTAGWLLTILEGLFWGNFINIVEHLTYCASAIAILIWSWKVFGKKGEQK